MSKRISECLFRRETFEVDYNYRAIDCPACNGSPVKKELVNYYPSLEEGDVICSLCGRFVKEYDVR